MSETWTAEVDPEEPGTYWLENGVKDGENIPHFLLAVQLEDDAEAEMLCRHLNAAAHNSGLVEALRVLWALTVEVRSYAGGLEGLAHAHGADLSAGEALGERIDAWYEANRAALTALERAQPSTNP